LSQQFYLLNHYFYLGDITETYDEIVDTYSSYQIFNILKSKCVTSYEKV